MSSVVCDIECHICGDKATGRNFGGISCESCKSFFRRAVNTKRVHKCKSGPNRCEINKDNRHLCKKCRFLKCLAVGMRKELIKKNMNELIDENVNYSTPSDGNSCSDSDRNSMSDLISNTSEDTIYLKTNSDFIDTEVDLVFNDFDITDEEISEGLRKMEELLSDSENSETEVTPPKTTSSGMTIVRPIATFDKPFNDIELSRFCELIQASNQIKSFTNCGQIEYRLEFKDLKEMHETMASLQIYDRLITDTGNFCRSITLFNDVCEDDKLSLFKFSCWKLISLKYLSVYSPCCQTFTFSISDQCYIKGDLSVFRGHNQYFNGLCNQFCEGLAKEWIRDPILLNLLMVLALFNCDAPNLKHRHQIKFNQQMYVYLLQRYLIQKFRTESKSSENLCQLMGLLLQLHQWFLVEVESVRSYSQLLSPLAKELLDR